MEPPQIDATVTTARAGDSAYVVSVAGELDLYSTPQLSAELGALIPDAPEVVLDLSAVTFMDSTALGALLAAGRLLRDVGGQLSLVAAADTTRKLLKLVGVDRVLPVYETPEQALQQLVGSVVLSKLTEK